MGSRASFAHSPLANVLLLLGALLIQCVAMGGTVTDSLRNVDSAFIRWQGILAIPGMERGAGVPLTWNEIRGERLDGFSIVSLDKSFAEADWGDALGVAHASGLERTDASVHLCREDGACGVASLEMFRGALALRLARPDGQELSSYVVDRYGVEHSVIAACVRSADPSETLSLSLPERGLLEYSAWTAFGRYWERDPADIARVKAHVAAKVEAFEKELVANADKPESAALYEVRELHPEDPTKNRYKRKVDELEKAWDRFSRKWDRTHRLKLPALPSAGTRTKAD